MDKQQIRSRIKAERGRLTQHYVNEKSAEVYERLLGVPELISADVVMTYADFNNEIRTGAITGWLLYKGKTVCLPVTEDGHMYAVRYRGTALEKGRFGVSQPALDEGAVVDPGSISVILCPGLAFSKNRARIGFGKGYYDQFMLAAPQAFKIGIAYDFQVLRSFDSEPQDIPMDMIVTPDYVLI